MKFDFQRWRRKASKQGNYHKGANDTRETVSQVRYEMESVLRQIARGYGRVGDQLDALHTLTSDLQGQCRGLLSVMGNEGNCLQLLEELSCSLRVNTGEIRSSVEDSSKLRDLMEACEGSALTLLGRQNSMVESLKPLRTMLVLFKIEAAALPAEHQSTFNSVSEEILKLHTLVDDAFQTNIAKLTEACGQIAKSIRRIEKERAVFASEVELELEDVESVLSDLEAQLSQSALNDQALQDAANSFEGATCALVSSLQYEDIIRQRCEAIVELIDGVGAPQSLEALKLILAEQVEMAADELDQSVGNIQASLAGILEQSRAFDASVGPDTLFQRMVAPEQGTIQKLLKSQSFIEGCSETNRVLIHSAQDAVTPVGTLASSLSDLVVEMSIDIQFIALNAQVRSIQVGEGSGLEVLAARTAEISTGLRELGEETSSEIRTLEDVVDQMSQKIGGTGLESAADTTQTASKLQELRADVAATLSKISTISRDVVRRVEAEMSEGLLEEGMQQQLKTLAKELRREVNLEACSPAARAKLEEEVKSHVEQSRKTVHTQVVDTRPAPAQSDSVARGVETPVASSDIEFF